MSDYDGPERRATSLEDIHDSIVGAGDGMKELAIAITKSAETDRRAQKWWMFAITLGVAFLSLVAVLNFVYIREANDAILQGHETGALIADCTTPGGECYKRNAASQAEAIKQINAEIDAAADKAARQVECDAGLGCAEGFTPRPRTDAPTPGTTTTTTTTTPKAGK